MKYVIQVIDHTNGNRSEPFMTDTKSLVESLLATTLPRENLLLCIGYVPDDDTKEMQISGNPLMTIDSFLKANNVIEEMENA